MFFTRAAKCEWGSSKTQTVAAKPHIPPPSNRPDTPAHQTANRVQYKQNPHGENRVARKTAHVAFHAHRAGANSMPIVFGETLFEPIHHQSAITA